MRDKTTVAASAWLNNTPPPPPPPSIHPRNAKQWTKSVWKSCWPIQMISHEKWTSQVLGQQQQQQSYNCRVVMKIRNSHTKQYMLRDHKQLLLLLCPNQQKSANLQSARKRIESLLCRKIKCVLKYISSVTIERWQLVDVRLMTIKYKRKKKAATSLGI